MFEWLDQEIKVIRTRRFHVVDGPAAASSVAAVDWSDVPFPRSYCEFVHKFGNAKLYRKLDYYKVGVLAEPQKVIEKNSGDIIYLFGHYDSKFSYFKESQLDFGVGPPVFEGRNGELVQVADGFEQWLIKRCKTARAKYKKREWSEILAGPQPFTDKELAILRARSLFTCRAVGRNPAGGLQFEVHNGSMQVLPFLSVGVEWERDAERFRGGVWLPVAHILPGQTAIVEHDAYNKMVDANNVDVFVLPNPEPEDRERYWEFKALS